MDFFILANECNLGTKVFMIYQNMKYKVEEADTWDRVLRKLQSNMFYNVLEFLKSFSRDESKK